MIKIGTCSTYCSWHCNLAALRVILNHSVVTITSLEMQLMTINCHNCREWNVAIICARPLTLSGRFLPYPQIAFGPVPTRSCPTLLSASHSGAGEVTRPESSGPADPLPLRSVHRVSSQPPDPARSCLDWPSRPHRVADYAWQRNTPPGWLVGADVYGRIAGWSSPSGDDRSGRRGLVDPMSALRPPACGGGVSFPTDHVVATPFSIVLLAGARKSMM
jgi:hypothetical protein